MLQIVSKVASVLLQPAVILGSGLILWAGVAFYNVYLSPLKDIPGPLVSKIFPVAELYHLIAGSFHEYVHELHVKYGPVIRIGGGRVGICHPDGWKELHQTYKYDKSPFYKHMRSVGTNMLTLNDRREHSARRRTVARVFAESNINGLEDVIKRVGVQVLVEKLENLIDNGKGKAQVDMCKEFQYLTNDIMGKLTFCKDLHILKNSRHKMIDWAKKVPMWLVLNTILPPIRLIGNPYLHKLTLFAKESIDMRRKEGFKPGDERLDLLGGLMRATDPTTGEGISDIDLMEECAELLVAGSDSLRHTMTWILFATLKNKHAHQRMVDEIRFAFPNKRADLSWKQVQKLLPYTHALINETMRLYPAAAIPFLRLVPDSGATILDYALPPRTQVFTTCYATHRSELLWYRPNEFLPERWLQDEAEHPLPKDLAFAFTPYSVGPRACPGRYLAVLEMHLTIASLFHRFDFSLVDPKTNLVPISYLVLHPKNEGPLLVNMEKAY